MSAPEHPPGQMTTSELAAYRRELERAVRGLPARAALRERLADVLAEEDGRARIAAANRVPCQRNRP